MSEQSNYYVVHIYRKDGKHFEVLKSENFDECKNLWKELNDKWKKSHDDQVPFKLEDPVVTAFEPALISEIAVLPLPDVAQETEHNPYKKSMAKNGLANTLNNPGPYPDILDQGFQNY